jgi:diguanylate cyclase (GGDEF)-like protein/PAS domain S-box-containing protein
LGAYGPWRMGSSLGVDERDRDWVSSLELDEARADGEGRPGGEDGDGGHRLRVPASQGSEELLRLSFDAAVLGVALVSLRPDGFGRLVRVNRAFCEFVGYGEQQLTGMTLGDLVQLDDLPLRSQAVRSMGGGEVGSWRVEKEFRRADGTARWGLMSAAVVHDDEGPLYAVLQVDDITARKEAEARLVHQAMHDALTGLANRALLHDQLSIALARAERAGTKVAVLFLDLDNFKTINDSLGHTAGDRLLVEVAQRLHRVLRGSDVAGRVGGDEFVVVCEDLGGPEDIPPVVERLLHELQEEVRLQGQELVVSASIGVAVGGAGSGADDLLRDADAAMYRAKARGKARWEIADEDFQAAAARVLEIEQGLREALHGGHLQLHYQPIVDLRSCRIVEVEALLRWRHPQRGVVLPGEFIEVAQERGLIVPIGTWVLQEACARAGSWHRRYPDDAPTVAVNVCSREVHSQQFDRLVLEALEVNQLPAGRLRLEITERKALDLSRSGLVALHELVKHGVRLAVDDFGAGFGEFQLLRRLPVTALKIDRGFVAGLGADRTDMAITRSIVTLGQSLDLCVIAEGVETPQQYDVLTELGCPLGQGWLWHPALPAPEIDVLLQHQAGLRGHPAGPLA